jgi:hypothetical protein
VEQWSLLKLYSQLHVRLLPHWTAPVIGGFHLYFLSSHKTIRLQQHGLWQRLYNSNSSNCSIWLVFGLNVVELTFNSSVYHKVWKSQSSPIQFYGIVFRLNQDWFMKRKKITENMTEHTYIHTIVDCGSREIVVCSNSATQHCYSVASSQDFVLDSVSTT